MTRKQAEDLKDKIKDICEEHCVWIEVTESHKPQLKDINIHVSIKIDK